jgi:hypothetical protein
MAAECRYRSNSLSVGFWRVHRMAMRHYVRTMTAVLDDPDEIAAVFRGSELDGLPIEEGLGDTWVITGLDAGRLLPAWRVARTVVDTTGRWPVLTSVDEQWQEPEDDEVEALEHAAETTDPWTVYRWWGDVTAERRAWERLLADPAALEQAALRVGRYVGTGQWFTPREGVQIVLLPTATQWLAPAWLSYFGAEQFGGDAGRNALAAAIRQWEREWGAELVASWGTMLQFVAARRPALGEAAWQLALQQLAIGGSLEATPSELALALTRSDAWFLHSRP